MHQVQTEASRLIVVGSANTDLILRVPRFPAAGETVLGDHFLQAAGGKGANQAVAAARAGAAVSFLGRVGTDAYGQNVKAGLRKEGIDVRHLGRDLRTPTGVALIQVAATGENCIVAAKGANGKLTPAHVRRAAALWKRGNILLVQLEVPLPAIACAVRLAESKSIPVILNPAPARSLPDTLLRKVTCLTPNETEAGLLTGIRQDGTDAQARRAAEALLRRGVKSVIITLSRRGAYVMGRGVSIRVAGFKMKAVDTTGAGDVFNGVLAVALLEGRPLVEAVRRANAAAALSVTRRGAQPSAPTRSEIDRLCG